jgi:hypothetical protein
LKKYRQCPGSNFPKSVDRGVLAPCSAVNDAPWRRPAVASATIDGRCTRSSLGQEGGPENRQRPAEQINGRDGSAARFALFAANNNIDIATRALWWDQPWQKERRFLFVLTCMAAAAGPVTSDPGRKPRSGGAERASLEGMAPVRPHGDKQVGTLTALGDSQPVAEALRRIGELYAIEARVRGRSSSTYRQAERGKLGPSPGQCFNRSLLTPCMAATICTSARTGVQESV